MALKLATSIGKSSLKPLLGTGSTFPGTIMAGTAIVDDGGSTVNGRFLAQSAVTLNNTTITRALCSPTIATTLSVPSV